MSRGHGHVQRKILELIEREPNGAWPFEELCRLVYERHATKARRVAIGRAIQRLKLPGTWAVEDNCGKCWLCDPCNLQSMRVAHLAHPDHFKPGGLYYEMVERAKRSRDGPLEPLNARSLSVFKSRTK